jgi:hypothetical protein
LLDREDAVRHLISLLRCADWLLTVEIEGWLADSYDVTGPVVDRALDRADNGIHDEKVRQSLLRVTGIVAQANLARSTSFHSCSTRSDIDST